VRLELSRLTDLSGFAGFLGSGLKPTCCLETLCGARISSQEDEARERRGREVGSTAARGSASKGRTPRGHGGGCFGSQSTLCGGCNPSKLARETEFFLEQHGRKIHGDVSPSPGGAKP